MQSSCRYIFSIGGGGSIKSKQILLVELTERIRWDPCRNILITFPGRLISLSLLHPPANPHGILRGFGQKKLTDSKPQHQASFTLAASTAKFSLDQFQSLNYDEL